MRNLQVAVRPRQYKSAVVRENNRKLQQQYPEDLFERLFKRIYREPEDGKTYEFDNGAQKFFDYINNKAVEDYNRQYSNEKGMSITLK